jgi:hypothetical protein
MPTDKASLMEVVDRIYESVEHPELSPRTIYAIGDFLGGQPYFWAIESREPPSPIRKTPLEGRLSAFVFPFTRRPEGS